MQRLLLLPIILAILAGCAASRTPHFTERIGEAAAPLELVGILPDDLQVGGELRITGDLTIPAGRTLRVMPGSRVLVLGNDSTKIDPEYLDKGTEVLVRGNLEVFGTPGQPVSFRPDPETPAGENWTGLEVVRGGRIELRHVDILGAELGLLLIDGTARLERTNLLGARYGLLLQGEGSLAWQGGRISGGDAGILCYDRARLQLEGLQILDNREEGLYLAAGCELQARQVLVSRNDLGLVAPAVLRGAAGLEVSDNRVDFRALGNTEGSP